ncbi:uncharacterized protein LOC121429063 [Lytechinus variegatus]|uniref:uncharacterized protein LOC121429063 n=1 Tax=Lytechinus variegatus TaxID=7654 RepID=UPI001BB17C19|nr:uncharacterized protein LOC121429063 [Lytechinus variegatus]
MTNVDHQLVSLPFDFYWKSINQDFIKFILVISGWYHLLREDVGRTKHLKVNATEDKKEEHPTNSWTRPNLNTRKRKREDDSLEETEKAELIEGGAKAGKKDRQRRWLKTDGLHQEKKKKRSEGDRNLEELRHKEIDTVHGDREIVETLVDGYQVLDFADKVPAWGADAKSINSGSSGSQEARSDNLKDTGTWGGGEKRSAAKGEPSTKGPSSSDSETGCMDRPDSLLSWISLHYVVLSKDKNGKYGFTLLDTLPVQVGSVETGSQAESSGLMKGDYFLEIGGYNVAGINSRGIKNVLKQTNNEIEALVQRHSDPTTRPAIPPRPSKPRRKLRDGEKEEEMKRNIRNKRMKSVKVSAAKATAMMQKRGMMLSLPAGSSMTMPSIGLVQKRLKRELIATVARRRDRMVVLSEEDQLLMEAVFLGNEKKEDDTSLGERNGPKGRWSSSTECVTTESRDDDVFMPPEGASSSSSSRESMVSSMRDSFSESLRDSARISIRDSIPEGVGITIPSPQRDAARDSLRISSLRNSFQEATKEFLKNPPQDSPRGSARNSLQDAVSIPSRSSSEGSKESDDSSKKSTTLYENAWIMMPRKSSKDESSIYEKANCFCPTCPPVPPRSPIRKLSEDFTQQIIVQPKLPKRWSPDGEATLSASVQDGGNSLQQMPQTERKLARSSMSLSELDGSMSSSFKSSLSERHLTRQQAVTGRRKMSLPHLQTSNSYDKQFSASTMGIGEMDMKENGSPLKSSHSDRNLAKPPVVARRKTSLPHIMKASSYDNQFGSSTMTIGELDESATKKDLFSERQHGRSPPVAQRKSSLPQLYKSSPYDGQLASSAMSIGELERQSPVKPKPHVAERRLAKVAPIKRETFRSKSEDVLDGNAFREPQVTSSDSLYANQHLMKKGKSQSFAALSRSLRREKAKAKPPVPPRHYVNERIGGRPGESVKGASTRSFRKDDHGDEDDEDGSTKMRCSFAQFGRMEEVLFAKGIEPFPLGPPDRDLVHAGRLFYFNRRKKFREVLVLLFNDALVMARSQHQDGRLRVIYPQLFILDISLFDFNCENAREFHITPVLSSGGHDAACHKGSIVFRAPSVKLKRSWQRVLTQQAMAVKYTSLGKVGEF